MLPLVEIPELVEHYTPFFTSVFSADGLTQFQRYLSGLIVSENKTVEGINRIFVIDVRNQSSLNRWLHASPFSVEAVNQARLALLASCPATAFKGNGVLSLDDTLLTHYGQHFDKIAYLYDPTQDCYVWAHNLVNLHYSDELTDYPVSFQLWEPAELDHLEAGLHQAGIPIRPSKVALKASAPKKWRQYLLGLWRRHQDNPEVAMIYQSKLLIGQQLVGRFYADHPGLKLPVTFDHWYTQPAFCRFLHTRVQVPYVGTLAAEDQSHGEPGLLRLAELDQQLQAQHQQAGQAGTPSVFRQITIPYKGTKETYYSYCHTHRIPHFGKQRLVINHQQADLADAAQFFISNKLNWQAEGITRIRRHRWPVEVYHEEGKAEGLDQYQVRAFEAITRHIALVALTYSLLRAAQHDKSLLPKLQWQLETTLKGSAGAWQRNTQVQALWALAGFMTTGLAQGHTLTEVMKPLIAAFNY